MDSQDHELLCQRINNAKVILLGGSAGSFTPIFRIIKSLPAVYDKVVVIIIHRGKNNFSDIENLFGDNCRIPVSEVSDKDNVKSGNVFIAPANYHTLFEKNSTFALDVSEHVWYSKPSIDVTFESAADAFGSDCAAILFSGANQDGAAGLLKLKTKGALTMVQLPEEAEMNVMPQAAVDLNAEEYILSTDEIVKLMRDSNNLISDNL